MDSKRVKALVVEDKKNKVANYHKNTIQGLKELLLSMGISDRNGINKTSIIRKISQTDIKSYSELYK